MAYTGTAWSSIADAKRSWSIDLGSCAYRPRERWVNDDMAYTGTAWSSIADAKRSRSIDLLLRIPTSWVSDVMAYVLGAWL